MEPTIELTLLQPTPAGDPLAGLLITVVAIWLVGVPWIRFCWWLGHRTRGARAAA